MVTDSERVLQALKEHLTTKDSHGRRELQATIAELEAKYSVDEGTIEKAIRVTGNQLHFDLLRYPGHDPATVGAAGVNGNGN